MKINPSDFKMIMGTDNNYLEIGPRNPCLKSKEVRFMGIYDTVSSIGVFIMTELLRILLEAY